MKSSALSVCPDLSRWPFRNLALVGWFVWLSSLGLLQGQELGEDYFESRIRPILLARCVECHGPDTQESGLRLDARVHLLTPETGSPVIDLQDPESSLLLRAITYQHDVQMPPDGPLDETDVAAFRQWITAGAPWPESVVIGSPMEMRLVENRQTHWAFQPIRRAPSRIAEPADRHPVDALLQEKMAPQGWSLSPPADDRTLVRRLYFTLLGLPPTPAELARYQADQRPDRWARLIDELLARPEYGERWARHWLDVARYADTQGYAFANDRRYPHAFTYRDYVVRAFNDDLPYDQFLLQQLAADQLDLGDDLTPLAALGFLTVGRRFIDYNDTLDDRIDVVTRGLLGLTVSCARCHDHKYDAISTADYYALHGVMNSSPDTEIKPPIGPRDAVEARQAFEQTLRERQGELDRFTQQHVAAQKQAGIERLAEYLLAAFHPPNGWDMTSKTRVTLSDTDLRPALAQRWKERLDNFSRSRGPEAKWFRPLRTLMALPDDDFVTAWHNQLQQWSESDRIEELDPYAGGREEAGESNRDEQTQESTAESSAGQAADNPASSDQGPRRLRQRPNRRSIDPDVLQQLREANLQSHADVAAFYARLIGDVFKTFQEHGASDRAVLKVEESKRFIIELYRGDSPLNIPGGEIGLYLSDADHERLVELRSQVEQQQAAAPPELPRAMAVADRLPPVTPYVFLRGNPNNRGPEVPRRFLTVLSSENEAVYPETASGRLQLAQQIVAPDNPLTARVIVNRVWMHHFGKPLVDTPSDFGVRCETPLQLELLDFLADYLQSHDWSLKTLHRLLLTSQAFQQSGRGSAELREADPENRYYARMNRRRMEWETLRDSFLAATDQLDRTVGGPAIDLFRSQVSYRRSLYGTIDRQDLPNLLRSFDFASPDTSVAMRPQTTVPQQSLYLMNGPLLPDLANRLLQNDQWTALGNPEEQVRWLFHRLLLRPPSGREIEQCLQFLAAADFAGDDDSPEAPGLALRSRWETLVQTLLMSNEFCFVD